MCNRTDQSRARNSLCVELARNTTSAPLTAQTNEMHPHLGWRDLRFSRITCKDVYVGHKNEEEI
jgi:hypothetical protein